MIMWREPLLLDIKIIFESFKKKYYENLIKQN